MTSRTVPVTFVRAAIEEAAARGTDLEPAAQDAGIPRAILADERGRCKQVTRFVRQMWRLSEDELFGMGRAPAPNGTFRLVCYALINSPDLRTVYQRLSEFGPALPALPSFTMTIDEDVTRLQTRLLSLPIVRDERELEDYLEHSPADLLARRDYGTTSSDGVRRILERGLSGEWPTSGDVASRLSISPQHVRRLLREEGSSLGQIRQELLRDAAIGGLARGESVEEISGRLGLSEPSAFRRAFKRWTGSTPTAYQPARTVRPR